MRAFIIFTLLLVFSNGAFSFGAPPPAKKSLPALVLSIDNFEDGNIGTDPEWWVFDSVGVTPVRSSAEGAFSLMVKGRATDWYVGGMGVYLAKGNQDLSQYTNLELDIFGNGPDSGMIKIELYDDDNGNWQIEQNPKKSYAPTNDDRFSFEQKVAWQGWKHVKIPFSSFTDNNPEAGDNIWNPQQHGSSGGLLQMQFIFMATNKTGGVNLGLDNVAFTAP